MYPTDRNQWRAVANRPSACGLHCRVVCKLAATATPSLESTGAAQGQPGKDGPAQWVAHPCLDLLVSGELPQLTPLGEEMR